MTNEEYFQARYDFKTEGFKEVTPTEIKNLLVPKFLECFNEATDAFVSTLNPSKKYTLAEIEEEFERWNSEQHT